jgi:uncharacterized membrane protein
MILRLFDDDHSPMKQTKLKGATMSYADHSDLSDNAFGGIAYLTLIPAIAFLLMEPFKKSSYVRFHAWQSIFFFAGQTIFFLLAWAVVDFFAKAMHDTVPPAVFLSLTVLQFVGLAIFIVWIFILIKAFSGKRIKLPVIGTLAEKQANR